MPSSARRSRSMPRSSKRPAISRNSRVPNFLLLALQGRIEANGLGVIGLGLILLAELVQGKSSRKIDPADIWIETDSQCKIGNRLGPLTQSVIDRAAVVIGREVIGIETDRLIEIGQRVIEVALAEIGGAALIECRGVVGRKLQHLIQILDCQVRLGLQAISHATAKIGRGQFLSAKAAKLDHTGTA